MKILDAPKETWQLRSGLNVQLRPLQSSDLALHWGLFYRCSRQSLFQRFFQLPDCQKITDADVKRFTNFDRSRELAITAVQHPTQVEELGVVRLAHLGGGSAEFALIVADPWHRQGLGRKLLEKAIEMAQFYGWQSLEGYVLNNNQPMLKLCRRLGFEIFYVDGLCEVRLALNGSAN
jgi:GNAT superfamily N-acetyltransferase